MANAKRIETILKKENPKGEEIGRALLLYQQNEILNKDHPHAPLFTQDQYDKMIQGINSRAELNKYLTFDVLHGAFSSAQIYLNCAQQEFYQGYYRLFDAVNEAIRAERFLTFLNKNDVAVKYTAPAPETDNTAEILTPEFLKNVERQNPENFLKINNHMATLSTYFDCLHGVDYFQLNPLEITLLNGYKDKLITPALRFFVDFNNFVEIFKGPLKLEFLDYAKFNLGDIEKTLNNYNELLKILTTSVRESQEDKAQKMKKVKFLKANFKPLDFEELTAGAKFTPDKKNFKNFEKELTADPYTPHVRKLTKTFTQTVFSSETRGGET